MLKVKNVNSFIVILCLFFCRYSFSQKISGEYCRNYKLDDFSTCINFLKERKFRCN